MGMFIVVIQKLASRYKYLNLCGYFVKECKVDTNGFYTRTVHSFWTSVEDSRWW